MFRQNAFVFWLKIAVGFLVVMSSLGQVLAAQTYNAIEAKDVIAIQLRAQGIPCSNPTKAVKDLQDSTPDEMTWVILCKEGTYRVKLIPHLGAKVRIIEGSGAAGDDLGIKE